MKLIAVLSLVLLLSCQAGDHPVGSVIKLLQGLQEKVESEGEAEQATYLKFKQWCSESTDTLGKAVQEEIENIDTLSDTVAGKTKQKADVEQNIAYLTEEIMKYEADELAAKGDREAANKLWTEADANLASTITAVDEALTALKDSKGAFLQTLTTPTPLQEHALEQLLAAPLVLAQLSDEQRDALNSALGKPVTEADITAKKTGAYGFKSGGVIELLKGLKTRFEDKKVEATKEETASANAYELAKGARTDAVEAAKTAKGTKTTLLGEVTGDLSTATGDLAGEKDEKKADSQTLDDTKRSCATKQSEFKHRTELRRHEIEAMKAAVAIMSKVTGVRVEAPKNKAAPSAPGANKALLLQVDDPKMKAVNLLRKEATQTHSAELSHFVDQLATKLDGPFDSVNNMVQKMIFRLMAEQKDEDEHKHWCDKEMAVSKASKENKAAKVSSLDAKIKAAKANSDELVLKVKDLTDKASKLGLFMADAAKVRQEGKKENTLAIKDAQEAQSAIAKAEAVLSTFYKDSGMTTKEPWEFLQVSQPVKLPKEPSSWDSSYTGVADPAKAGTGVIAVLKATATDFAKMEADTRAQEITDQSQFDTDMKDAAIDKAKTSKEAEMKTDENKRALAKVNSMTKAMKLAEHEKGAVDQYLKDLEPACVNGDSTYADRKTARDSEIKSLKDAQVILKDAFAEKPASKLLQSVSRHA